MQSYLRVHVELGRKDRRLIAEMLRKGQESARVLRRASILRQLDSGQKVAQVAENVGVARKTVRAVARRYEEEGLDSALYERPRPGKERALNTGQSRRIVAMVCGPPPEGRARWSVRLIARRHCHGNIDVTFHDLPGLIAAMGGEQPTVTACSRRCALCVCVPDSTWACMAGNP